MKAFEYENKMVRNKQKRNWYIVQIKTRDSLLNNLRSMKIYNATIIITKDV